MAASLRYRLPGDDICDYLVGTWKRNLEWREFGPGFEHVRTSNSLVVIETCEDAAVEPGTKLLDWRFGSNPDEMKIGYSMQFFPGSDGETTVEWTYEGGYCRGDFSPVAAALSLSFRYDEGVVSNATYRAVDANSWVAFTREINKIRFCDVPTTSYDGLSRRSGQPTYTCHPIRIHVSTV